LPTEKSLVVSFWTFFQIFTKVNFGVSAKAGVPDIGRKYTNVNIQQ